MADLMILSMNWTASKNGVNQSKVVFHSCRCPHMGNLFRSISPEVASIHQSISKLDVTESGKSRHRHLLDGIRLVVTEEVTWRYWRNPRLMIFQMLLEWAYFQ
jgi:hypothetical protein